MNPSPSGQDSKPNPAPTSLAPRKPRRRWWRFLFFCLFALLGGAFLFVAFLNKVGLPEFIKERLVAEARLKGLNLEFSRIRLSWRRGLLIEDLQLSSLLQRPSPQLFAEETRLRLDRQQLKQRRLRLDGIFLDGANLYWPIGASNLVDYQILTIRNLDADLQQTANDQWRLKHLRGRVLDIDLHLTGMVTNASRFALLRRPRVPKSPTSAAELYRRFLGAFAQIKFDGVPSFSGRLFADGANIGAGNSSLTFTAAAIGSPWATGTNVSFTIELLPTTFTNGINVQAHLSAGSLVRGGLLAGPVECRVRGHPMLPHFIPTNVNAVVHLGALAGPQYRAAVIDLETDLLITNKSLAKVDLDLDVGHFTAFGAEVSDVSLHAGLSTSSSNLPNRASSLRIQTGLAATRWASARQIDLKLDAVHHPHGWLPASLSTSVAVDGLTNAWGIVGQAAVQAALTLPEETQSDFWQTNRSWPDGLTNLSGQVELFLADVHAQELHLPEFKVRTEWKPPLLTAESTNRIGNGILGFVAHANFVTREAQFNGMSTFDPYLVKPWLTTNTQRWLGKYTWQDAPFVEGAGRVILPAWTNRHPDWRQEVLPTLSMAGRFRSGAAAYRKMPFSSARSEFFLTNKLWHLPELVITRPEGTAVADYHFDQGTRDFHWRLHSEIDPRIARTLVEKPSQQKIFDYFELTRPPIIDAEIWGRMKEPDRVGVIAHVVATNFAFRGEAAEAGWSQIRYTNRFLEFIQPEVLRPNERGSANGVSVDLIAKMVTITNAFGNLNPRAVARAISPKALEVIEPYHFDVNPTVRANGLIDYAKNGHKTDARFEISGGLFHWKAFNLQEIRADIDWSGQTVLVTNLAGQAYGGRVSGDVALDFTSTNGGKFAFNTTVAGIDLRSLMQDLTTRSNTLEGEIGGEIRITHALLADTNSWDGFGHVQLRDGLIWDIPVFGVFSPILNMLVPGLGNSRAREATSTFSISNSVISTDNLEIAGATMRMRYLGSVGFDTRVNGRMEAELLRNIPGLGFFIAKLFWPVTKVFQYRISGTLGQPKTEPLHFIPRVILMPLQPVKTLKELFTPPPVAPPPAAPAP